MSDLSFRLASPEDASFLAGRVREVSHGVVDALLLGLLPGIGPEQILSMVLRDTSSHFSHKNCVLACEENRPVGLLFAYPWQEQSIPGLMRTMIPKDRLSPLIDILTAVVPDSLYINTFWVAEDLRGQGLSDALMDYVKDWARDTSLSKLSLFAWRDNSRALAFYERHGFVRFRAVEVPEAFQEQNLQGDLYSCEL